VRKTLGDPQDQKQVAQQADDQPQHLHKKLNLKINIATCCFKLESLKHAVKIKAVSLSQGSF
jgi:hypothetical protein